MMLNRRQLLTAASAAALPACAKAPIIDARCVTPPECVAGRHLATASPSHGERCALSSYDEMQLAEPVLLRPQSVAELQRAFAELPKGHHVTLRGGGQSLDSQALNHDFVIAMDSPCFAEIGEPRQAPDGNWVITTGAGARWYDVIEKVAELGLFPPSLATAPRATVGGTLSADCVSRMSFIHGKESRQIRSFKLVTPDGALRVCSRTQNANLFHAAIGGFGYLGAVTEVEFDLVPIRGTEPGKGEYPRVLTRSTRHQNNVDWDRLLRTLRRASDRDRHRLWDDSDKSQPPKRTGLAPMWNAVSVASFLSGQGMTANLLEQRFVEQMDLRPTPGEIYARRPAIPVTAAKLAPYWPTLVEFATDVGFPNGEFVDDLFGWAFFFGNWADRAKADAHRCGNRMNYTQHTYALPASTPGRAIDTRPTRRFLEALEARLHAADVRPATIDLLYVLQDDCWMSASRGMDAYLVTVSLADMNQTKYPPETRDMLLGLSRDCRELGGRVHLVKSVVATKEDLRAMYGQSAAQFRALKDHVDPEGKLQNEFFERVFKA